MSVAELACLIFALALGAGCRADAGADADVDSDATGSSSGDATTTGFDTDADEYVCDMPEGGPLVAIWMWTPDDGAGTEDSAGPLAVAADGSTYVALNYGVDDLDFDLQLARLTADGELTWKLSASAPSQTGLSEMVVAADGNLYAAGSTFVNDPQFGLTSALFVAAYDPDGQLLWTDDTPTMPPNPFTQGATLAAAPDGGVVVGGPGAGGLTYLRRYEADGTIAWTVDGPGGVSDVAFDSSGEFHVLGSDGIDALIERRDAAGTLIWSMPGPGPGEPDYWSSNASRGRPSPDGDLVAAGLSGYLIGNPMDPTDSWSDLWIRSLDPSGAEVWTAVFERYEDYSQMEVLVDALGDPMIVNRTMAGPPYLRQLDSGGALQWEAQLACPHDGLHVALADDELVFAGRVDTLGQGGDAFVGRFGPS